MFFKFSILNFTDWAYETFVCCSDLLTAVKKWTQIVLSPAAWTEWTSTGIVLTINFMRPRTVCVHCFCIAGYIICNKIYCLLINQFYTKENKHFVVDYCG